MTMCVEISASISDAKDYSISLSESEDVINSLHLLTKCIVIIISLRKWFFEKTLKINRQFQLVI